mgnify:CR=1 FL=1
MEKDTNDEYQPRDDYFDFNDKCLYLDPVYENTRAGFIIRKDINNVFLVEVNCTNLVGIHNISLDFISMANNVLCSSEEFKLEVIPEVLPKHDLKVTHWFYQDCLQEHFHYKFMSKPYMKVLEKYVDEYVEEVNLM